MRHLIRLVSCLALGTAWSCSGSIGDPGSTYSDTDLYNPGMGGAGNVGPMNQFIPTDWSYLGGSFNFGTFDVCLDTGFCAHGGAGEQFGTMVSAEDSLIYILTANYTTEDPNDNTQTIVVAVRSSGVEHDEVDLPATPTDKKLRLAFQYAFLTSRDVDGDSAVVRIVSDGNLVSTPAPLRIHSGDLGAGIPLRSGGCGTESILPDDDPNAVETTYNRCSDWQDGELDLSTLRGHTIKAQFVVGEDGVDTDHGIALLIRQVRIQQED